MVGPCVAIAAGGRSNGSLRGSRISAGSSRVVSIRWTTTPACSISPAPSSYFVIYEMGSSLSRPLRDRGFANLVDRQAIRHPAAPKWLPRRTSGRDPLRQRRRRNPARLGSFSRPERGFPHAEANQLGLLATDPPLFGGKCQTRPA